MLPKLEGLVPENVNIASNNSQSRQGDAFGNFEVGKETFELPDSARADRKTCQTTGKCNGP